MNMIFFKTNWFYFSIGILFLIYGIRKYSDVLPGFEFSFTTEKAGSKRNRKAGAALLGLVQDTQVNRKKETKEVSEPKAESFLKRFTPVVLSEHKKFGIPASIMLACAYVNSQAGLGESATEANNFFALNCADGWEGETVKIDGDCFRKYESAWASFRDFSIYLSSQDWFGALKKSAAGDETKWAEKLGKEGIANAKALQKVLEAYDLYELDTI